MTAEDVQHVVLAAIGNQWDRWSADGLSLKDCVVLPPRLETYVSHTSDGSFPFSLWLVVEESPVTHDGYEVFYDPDENNFGLGAVGKDGERQYMGNFGSLWNTLEGM
ncbi:MAG: hypothetical protein JWO05_3550 [Gemmatimonadetes bacterium]|nr:hypothetical protein [Gemmatimonadota bacterium]